MDYYKILEVSQNASQEEISNQYKFLIQAWHPDKFQNPLYKEKGEEITKKLNEAYLVLKDPEKRAHYDQERSSWRATDEQQKGKKQSDPPPPPKPKQAPSVAKEESVNSKRISLPVLSFIAMICLLFYLYSQLRIDETETVVRDEDAFLEQPQSEPEISNSVMITQENLGIGLDTQGENEISTYVFEIKINLMDQAEMIQISSGEFTMGITPSQNNELMNFCGNQCTSNHFTPSEPSHKVFLSSFWIYKYEVTNNLYRTCVNDGVCNPPRDYRSETRQNYYNNATYGNYPVVFVTWYDANEYCKWAGGRLPSEAEWEKAARGETGFLFPWGNEYSTSRLANVGMMIGDTTEVGSYPDGKSPFGLMDMAGNVYEWVNDWYSDNYYNNSPYQNPEGPSNPQSDKNFRSIRGGNWFWSGVLATSAFHDWWESDASSNDVGFRCVVDD